MLILQLAHYCYLRCLSLQGAGLSALHESPCLNLLITGLRWHLHFTDEEIEA